MSHIKTPAATLLAIALGLAATSPVFAAEKTGSKTASSSSLSALPEVTAPDTSATESQASPDTTATTTDSNNGSTDVNSATQPASSSQPSGSSYGKTGVPKP